MKPRTYRPRSPRCKECHHAKNQHTGREGECRTVVRKGNERATCTCTTFVEPT